MTAKPSPMEAPHPMKITVLGAGAFGTAMAFIAGKNKHEVRWYARDEEQVAAINKDHKNPKYLSSFDLPENIRACSDIAECLAGTELIIHALPAQKTPDWIREHRELIPADVVFCSTAKGLYLKGRQFLSEAMMEAFDRPQKLAFLSGPSFAAQICGEHPSAVVVASRLLADAVTVQRALSSVKFRIYTSQDTIGVELGGALKNPLAIGAGMIEGCGYGINTMAAYITRASRELTVLCIAMGGKPETIAGLSGIGDLMLTCFGELSRNRTCGTRLAKGEKLEDILSQTTVEGVPTAQVAVDFAERCGLDLPIFATAKGILDGSITMEQAPLRLMGRPLGSEVPLL